MNGDGRKVIGMREGSNLLKLKKEKVISKYAEYLLLFCVCVVFLLFFSISTSPLTSNTYGSDSAFFQMVGQSMVRGKIIYQDIFDNKGPYLYLIQYLGQRFSYGRIGIFVIQVINLCTAVYFADRACQIVCGTVRGARLVSILVFFFCLMITLDGGNLSEEYSLSAVFVCLYLFFRFLQSDRKSGFLSAVIVGGAFGFIAFIRLTNAGFLCVIILTLLIDLFFKRQFQKIILCMGGFITGLLLVTIPVCMYCVDKDILSEMIYSTFVFNFFYGIRGAGVIRYGILFILIVSALLSLLMNRNEKIWVIFSLASVIGTVGVLVLGNAYIHYYQLMIPPVLANIWLVMRKYGSVRYKNVYLWIVVVMIVCLNSKTLIYQGLRSAFALGANTPETEKTVLGKFAHIIEEQYAADWWKIYGYRAAEQVYDILEQIPEDSYDDVYNYNTRPYWLRVSGVLPYNKYCQTQESFIAVNAKIRDEIEVMFEQQPPGFVVIENPDGIYNKEILLRLKEQYYIKYQNDVYVLYEKMNK